MYINYFTSILCVILCFGTQSCFGWLEFFGEELHKHPNLQSHHQEWDLLQVVNGTPSFKGDGNAAKSLSQTPSWKLQHYYERAVLNMDKAKKITSSLKNEIAFYFVFKQHHSSIGSLFSINLPGKIKPFFQIISNLKAHRLHVKYRTIKSNKIHQLNFKMPKKVGFTWSKILVSINDTQIKVWINCDKYEKGHLGGHIDLHFPKEALLYFRQEPGLKNKLLGNIQTGKIFNYSFDDRVWKCSYDAQFGPSWRPPLLG